MNPTLQEEIDRKARDTLYRTLEQYRSGEFSKAEYLATVKGAWSAIAGLCDPEIMDLFQQFFTIVSEVESFEQTTLRKGAMRFVVSRNRQTNDIEVYGFTATNEKRKSHSFDPIQCANPRAESVQTYNGIIEKLKTNGFVSLSTDLTDQGAKSW